MSDLATLETPAPEPLPITAAEIARERIKYKSLYEEMCAQVDSLEHSHRELALELRTERERLKHQVKVTTLQDELIGILRLHASWTWTQSPPIDEDHPF